MSGINKVILIGHLGENPDLRRLADNITVSSFPLATTEMQNKDGGRVEVTEWHNIVMWRGMAESAGRLLHKGDLVYIEGKLRTRSFVDKAGVRKAVTEIMTENFVALSKTTDLAEIAEE
ncbi:single-stranded DNA-binding protein [Mucilaginibacter sp. PAMB04274]|uniref:single-stranded DNA-binding protein n=1 Tax=Mucilaginibacter sp. PAMB04274 TaxID=3138568 RepID=UPI0031F6A1C2